VGGGARGAETIGLPAAQHPTAGHQVSGAEASLVALVPAQVALTTSEQPSLFWFQSQPATAKLELTLIEPGHPQPLLILGSSSDQPGIHRIRLLNHGVKLALDVAYKWTVSLIADPTHRSLDVVATGMVKRVEPSAELTRELGAASVADRPAIYAQAGIWYDALEAISDEIDQSPGDSSLRRERTDLLKQVSLPSVDQH
jgi:hypothetical protein